MNTISNITRDALLSTSHFISNLEANHLHMPRRLRMFTDADVPELQLLQSAYLLALLSYAFAFNPLTELLFPFPGGRARARRVCFFVPLLAWGSLVLVSISSSSSLPRFVPVSFPFSISGCPVLPHVECLYMRARVADGKQSYLPLRLMGDGPADIVRYLYVRIARAQGRSPADVCEDL